MDFDYDKFHQEYDCVEKSTLITIKDKETNKIYKISIGEFYDMLEFLQIV